MKTPDEIKRGLEICSVDGDCSQCPYFENLCVDGLMPDNFAYIRQLEREKEALMEDFRVYRERIIKKEYGVYACDLCKHGGKYEEFDDTTCPEGCDGIGHWEWRGVEEEER